MRQTSFNCSFLVIVVIIFLTALPTNADTSDLQQQNVIVTFPKNFPPNYNLTPEGVPYGFAIDVISDVARIANITLEYRPMDTWAEVLEQIVSGKADLIPNVGISPERAQLLLFTQPYEKFSVRIFTLKNTQNIKSIHDLKGLRVGTTELNIVVNMIKNFDLIPFSSSEQVVTALLNQKLDALILPDIVVRTMAGRMDKLNELTVVGDPITVVKRAIGVSHSKPKLHQKLDDALTEYMRSQEFRNTRRTWGKLPTEDWSPNDLIILNVFFFLVLCLLISGTLYRKFRHNKQNNIFSSSKIEIRTISIIGVLFVATLLSMLIALWLLYKANVETQRIRMENIAQNRANIIENFVRTELRKEADIESKSYISFNKNLVLPKKTLSYLRDFARTGEFTFASKTDDKITYILSPRHADKIRPKSVPWNSPDAEAMRRALSGRSGTMIGLDYRGIKVLAAYEPVRSISAGIVAKIDLAELREPFTKAGLVSLAVSQCVIFACYLLFLLIASPILLTLSRAYIQLGAIINHSSNLIVIKDSQGETILKSPECNGVDETKLVGGESSIVHSDGSTHNYLTTQFPLKSPDQVPFGSCQISMDITERVATEFELKQYALAFENTSEGVIITDKNSRITAVNSAFEEITGYKREEVYGRNPDLLKSGLHNDDFYSEMWDSLNNKGCWSGEIWNRKKNGETFPEWLNINSVRNEHNEELFYVAVFSDITSLKKTQEELHYLAHHDPLTKLPNRLLLKDRLDHSLKNARREQELVALLVIDMDRFKSINGSLGHPAGDSLLKHSATRLENLVRENDTVARLGGDEFAIIAENIISPQSATQLAQKIVTGMTADFNLGDHVVFTSISVGIAIYPQDGETYDDLLKHADIALYKAKERGRNNYQLYTKDLS